MRHRKIISLFLIWTVLLGSLSGLSGLGGAEVQAAVLKATSSLVLPRTKTSSIMSANDWALGRGFIGTDFEPEKVCTRGELVLLLWRVMGEPTYRKLTKTKIWKDVPKTDELDPAASWALTEELVAYGDEGLFDADKVMTNGQLFAWLEKLQKAVHSLAEDGLAKGGLDETDLGENGLGEIALTKTGRTEAAENIGREITMQEALEIIFAYAESTDTQLAWPGTDAGGNAGFDYFGFAVHDGAVYLNVGGVKSSFTGVYQDENYWYHLEEGRLVGGWAEIDGRYYFTDRDTWLLKSGCYVNQIWIGTDGAAEQTEYAEEKVPVMMKARDIVYELCSEDDNLHSCMKEIIVWMRQYPYLLKDEPVDAYMDRYACWPAHYANNILNAYGDQRVLGGQCTARAAAFGFLALELGVDHIWVMNGTHHSWMQTRTMYYDSFFAIEEYNFKGWMGRDLPHPYMIVSWALLS